MISVSTTISAISIDRLHKALMLDEPCRLPEASLSRPLPEWRMERDDAVILQYLFRQLRPLRHLEFGTWQGAGTVLCLEHCAATVWTINLLEGERDADGQWAYYNEGSDVKHEAGWVNKRTTRSGKMCVQTDALGCIGKMIHEKGYGHRVCQIYCDSRDWDTSAYPSDFFDTVLIDGGHSPNVVISDTAKALSVLRPGGVVIWHDYCPDPEVIEACVSVRGVVEALESLTNGRCGSTNDLPLASLFWIKPSWLAIGIKRAV